MNHATERSHGNERNVSLLSFIFGTFSILLILVHVSHPRQKKFASTKLLGITWFRTVFSIQLSFSGRLKGEGAVAGFQSKKISFCEWRGERNRRLCFSFTALAVYAFNFYCNWRLIIIRPLLLPADVDVFAPPPGGGGGGLNDSTSAIFSFIFRVNIIALSAGYANDVHVFQRIGEMVQNIDI